MGRDGGIDKTRLLMRMIVEVGDGFMPFIILSSLFAYRSGNALNRMKVTIYLHEDLMK